MKTDPTLRFVRPSGQGQSRNLSRTQRQQLLVAKVHLQQTMHRQKPAKIDLKAIDAGRMILAHRAAKRLNTQKMSQDLKLHETGPALT